MNDARIQRGLPPDAEAPHLPIAIVGGGACGLTAALMLADIGIDCVVLERDAQASGSTALSSGFIPAAGTAVQRAAGVEDSAEAFAADIQGKAHGDAAAHLVAAYTEAAAAAIDALQARHGLNFELLDGFLYPGHSVRRMHSLPQRTGAALTAALQAAAEQAGVMVVTEARVTEIWCDEASRVQGVGYARPDGSMEYLHCDALLLACNGFGGNREMVSQYLPAIRDAEFGGHVGNDGSAIAWGQQLGARLADMGAYQGHGSWAVPQGTLVSWAVIMDGGVQINRQGRRFHDETLGYSEAAEHVLAQPDGIAWNVFDAQTLALAQGFPDFRDAQAAGAVRTCADVDALAAVIGCPPDALRDTLSAVQPNAGDGFGRAFTRALSAPYYAIKVTGALFHTQGGLDIDAACRVLRDDGTPLPNLYAAGGAARGVSGTAVWGYLSGNGLLSAVAGGFIAARSLAATLSTDET